MSPKCGPDASGAAQLTYSEPSRSVAAVAVLRGASHLITKAAGRMRAKSIDVLTASKAVYFSRISKCQAAMGALASVTLFFVMDSALRSVFVANGFVFPSSLAGKEYFHQFVLCI